MFRSLGVPVKGPMALCGNNLRMIISSTNHDSELKKKHMVISYHKLWESAAAGIFNPIKFCTAVNQYDMLTNSTPLGMMGSFLDASYGVIHDTKDRLPHHHIMCTVG